MLNGVFLVTVVVRLVGAFDGNSEVLGLLVSEGGKMDIKVREVKTSDLLIKLLGKEVNTDVVLLRLGPESDLEIQR